VVLVLAICAVVLLTALAVGIVTAVRVELRAAHLGVERMQGLFLAQAGASVARSLLLYQDDVGFDALDDPWGPYAEWPLDMPQPMGEGYYRVRVYDNCGLVDINAADYDMLFRLIGDPAVAEEIINWRQANPLSDYYDSLAYPYQPRGGPFQSVGELLLVRGVTPEMFFGAEGTPGLVDLVTVDSLSENTDAQGRGRFRMTDALNAVVERPDFDQWFRDNYGDLLDLLDLQTWKNIFLSALNLPQTKFTALSQLVPVLESYSALGALDYVTVSDQYHLHGLVNVNTAPAEVLAELPGGSVDLAQRMVEQRANAPFASLGELAQFIQSESGPEALLQMVDHVTTKSSSFTIETMGSPGEGRGYRTLRLLARRMQDNVVVVQQFEEDQAFPPYEEQAVQVASRR
jgi:type II secretory pathway component PulK